MAKKKQFLKSGLDTDISLIGISSQLRSYRLSFAMNEAMNFKFKRIDDFQLQGSQQDDILQFPFFIYDDTDMKNHFCLVGNHHPAGNLVPSLRQVDYFLMARNPLEDDAKQALLSKVRKISKVMAALEIDPLKTKDMDMLLEEMEIHMLEAGRKK
jgi:hypothetical protein